LRDAGRVDFHGVAVKPGKPLLLGSLGETPVLGLAGNPASCLLMTEVLVVPWVRAFQRLPPTDLSPRAATLAHDVSSPPGKRHFLPVRLQDDKAESVYRESDATTSLSRADGYIEIPDDVERLAAGTRVQVHPF
jgi:molybdopterin biosynthesis enzyme